MAAEEDQRVTGLSQVFARHASPGRPVVRVQRVPNVELVGNALFIHDPIELLIFSEAMIVPAAGQ